jgi:serine/threonine protein kinase
MIVAFNTSTFSTNLDEYGGDEWTGIDFNAQATVTIVEDGIEVTYIATIITSKSPTSQPTLAPHEASPTSPSGPDAAFISIVAASFIVVVCIGVRIGRQVYGGSRKDKNETNRDSAVTGEISQLYKVEMLTRTSDNFSNMSRISNMSNLSNVSNFSNVSSFSNTSNSSASSHIDFGGDHLSGAYHIPRNKLTLEAKPFARGGGGQIFKGRYGASLVAAQQVFSNLDSGRMEEFERETGMLVELKHPNILSLFGTTMDEDGSLYQILEFCDGGDLQGYYTKPEFTLEEFKRVGLELLSGVAYLHERLIVHRDLKPENALLLGDKKQVKIADFGLAKANRNTEMTIGVGTPAYMPPEMFDDVEVTSTASMTPMDVYAIGIILAQLWTKRAPWQGKSPHKVMTLILKGKRPPLDGFKDKGPSVQPPPDVLRNLIVECWSAEPEKRPSIMDVFTRFEKEVIPAIEEIITPTRTSRVASFISSVLSPRASSIPEELSRMSEENSIGLAPGSSNPMFRASSNTEGMLTLNHPASRVSGIEVGMTNTEGRKIKRASQNDDDVIASNEPTSNPLSGYNDDAENSLPRNVGMTNIEGRKLSRAAQQDAEVTEVSDVEERGVLRQPSGIDTNTSDL